MPGRTRLEAHPAVLTAVSLLLEPDCPGESDQVEHQPTQLFGVPLVAAPLEPGDWRLVAADGTVLDRAGPMAEQIPDWLAEQLLE